MSVIIGAIVGAIVTVALTVGIFFLTSIIPPLGICNCGCCIWPIAGGVVGAFVAIKMAGEGGAGKGAAVGLLSGVLTGGAIVAISFASLGLIVGMIPNMWDSIRTKALTDETIEQMKFDLPNEQLKTDVKDLLKKVRNHSDFKDVFKEFKGWLTDERIEAIAMANQQPSERDKTRQLLKELQTSDYETATKKVQEGIGTLKVNLLGGAVIWGFFLSGLFALMGLFGGIVGGALFATERSVPPPMPAA